MDLQEEYFIRNNVDHPLIRYNVGGSVLLQQNGVSVIGSKWKILNIIATNKEGNPGRFDKKIFIPQYNGQKNYGIFSTPEYNEEEDSYYW